MLSATPYRWESNAHHLFGHLPLYLFLQVADTIPEEHLGCDNESFVYDNEEEPLAWALRGRKMEFTASSPDEKVLSSSCCQENLQLFMKALVEACQRLGVTFVGEDQVESRVRIVDSRGSGPPCLKTFQRLHILDFDSTRKRMSVIVRNPSGSLVLVTKGAESSILPLCTAGPVLEVNRSIDEYAVQGLRSEIVLSAGVQES